MINNILDKKENLITVEVAFADVDELFVCAIQVSQDTTVSEAINLSGVCDHFKQIKINDTECSHHLAIFGKKVKPDDPLKMHDRIDILRVLTVSAMDARRLRLRAQKQKAAAKQS